MLTEGLTKLRPRWTVHLPGVGNRAGESVRVLQPLIVGQCGSTAWLPSFRLARPAMTLLTLVCTAALFPKHRSPPSGFSRFYGGSLSYPALARLIGVEVLAVPGRFTRGSPSSSVRRCSRTALATVRWLASSSGRERGWRPVSPNLPKEGVRLAP